MRKVPFLVPLVVAFMAVAALPAGAAPQNGSSATEVILDCQGDEVIGLVQFETASAAVFDFSLATNGRRYVLSSLDDRIYEGDQAVEPDPDDALVTTSKSWGKRIGFDESLECTGRVVLFEEGLGFFTWFGDLILSGK